MLAIFSSVTYGFELLPPGIGIYQVGVRTFTNANEAWDNGGSRQTLTEQNTTPFNGQNLTKGKGGSDLQKLASEIARYDAGLGPNQRKLADRLYLGELKVEAQAAVQASFFGLGYGLTPNLTTYLAIPWVKVDVASRISFGGRNNAIAVKDELGDAAFDELKDGLEKASTISLSDITQNLEDKGYTPITDIHQQGVGDIFGGFRTVLIKNELSKQSTMSLGLDASLSLPTGYVENPGILNDVSIGRGFTALQSVLVPSISLYNGMSLAGKIGLGVGLPAKARVRVPEGNETLTESERDINVTRTPGQDLLASVSFLGGVGWFKGAATFGAQRHTPDKFSGSLDGNYAALADRTSQYEVYSEVEASMTTVEAFQAKTFPIPLILTSKYHHTVAATNKADQQHLEFSLASFFKLGEPDRREGRGKKVQKS